MNCSPARRQRPRHIGGALQKLPLIRTCSSQSREASWTAVPAPRDRFPWTVPLSKRPRCIGGAVQKLCLCALTIATLVLGVPLFSYAAVVSEDFAADPAGRGWRAF